MEIFKRVINQYGPHATAAFIVLFAVTHNLQATAGTDSVINNNSILYSFLGPVSGEELIEEKSANLELVSMKKKYTSNYAVGASPIPQMETQVEQKVAIEIAHTMTGGNTLIKPIITDSDPTLATQKLIDSIFIYEVTEGDTIGSIAQKFGISTNTILWENKLRARDYIQPGQKLTILPTSGIRHTVKRGENIQRIASKYNIEAEKILAFNNFSNAALIQPGQKIIIPEGSPIHTPAPKKITAKKIFTSKSTSAPNPNTGMIWPTIGKVITQYWHWRHFGLDIDGVTGDPIFSADKGKVVVSGWNNGGYGLQVVVDHENGYKTRYAHCSKLLVSVGDRVEKGETVCLMGNTGRSTGSHLHFEVIVNGVRKNPLNYISK